MNELDRIQRQGYAINDQELAAGIRSVAAPVRGSERKVIAAINISVPSARASRQEMEEILAPMVIQTARQISLALGAEV
jgi:IclR family pca regulon transcriptional regulator